MYLGFSLILAGIALLLGSFSPWIAVPSYAVWVDRAYIADEERSLSSRFGWKWKVYASHIRRWI
jgi:protein-S-isoprenylcysteine O-methyltransferase Ste14